MSNELAQEILDYVKLRDRPSRMELRVWGGTPMNRIMNITAPIEEGKLVYRSLPRKTNALGSILLQRGPV